MNYELFIAKRIIAAKEYKSSISAPIIKIAIIAIAMGLVIMMIAMATGLGLQTKIREKLSGFNGHIQITNFDNNNSEITLMPVSTKQDFYPGFKTVSDIKNVQKFATKAGIIRTEIDFEGIVFKGIGEDYDWSFFKEYLIAGAMPDYSSDLSSEVMISKLISDRMDIQLGDEFNIFFVKDDPNKAPWLRVVKAVGIYKSDFQEFDQSFVIGDIRHIQKMNRWGEDEVGGFEVLLDDFDDIDEKSIQVYEETTSTLNSQSIVEKYADIFEWIGLFDTNIFLIILSTAHFKLIAVGLEFIKSIEHFLIKLKSLFSFIASTIPKAAVAPINGAPLTSIVFIALIESFTVSRSLIINLCGSFVWSIIFTTFFSYQIVL